MKKLLLSGLAASMLSFSSMAQQTIRGLTVLVEFTGASFPESTDSVALLLNQPNFSGWGNQGSVRDFFYTQSNNKVILTSEVIKVSLPHPNSYYRTGGGQDVPDIINAINTKYPAGFQNLTLKSDNSLVYFTILTKAGGGAWAFGGVPAATPIKNNGQNAYINSGNITNYDWNEKPQYNTICHEMGHSVMQWPDYYQTAWSNLGNYCVMGSAGNRTSPQQINPALRLQKGWIDNVIEIGQLGYDQEYTATANSYSTIYKYKNPNNPKEYLLVHPQVYGKYYQQVLSSTNIADQGLAIYYVDEDGGMDLSGLETSYKIKLLQADNKDDLHDEDKKPISVRGDYFDLYDHNTNNFPNGTPFRWKDGGEFGLHIGEISAPGPTMNFTVYARYNTHIVTTDKYGTVSPKGVIETTNKTYTLLPNPGYTVYQVKVNNAVVPVSGNTFTVNGIGNKNIHVTFQRAPITPLPSPWYNIEIGNHAPGFSAHSNGKFHIESYGVDVWGNSDHFRFVYRSLVGDGSIIAKRAYVNSINNWSKAGIMIRESLQPDAAYSFLFYAPRNNTRVQQRSSTGAYSVDNPDNYPDLHWLELYPWYKITRVGNVISSYVSRDQITWKKLAEETIAMGAQVYVGLAASGVNDIHPTVAQFTDVTVTGAETAPNVTFTTSAACGNNNQTIALELAASKRVNATGYNWYYSGSGQSITPVSNTGYKANFVTGNNFNGTQVCVGVSYGGAPYYTSYCVALPKCVSAREDFTDTEEINAKAASFPNPFSESTTLTLPMEGEVAVYSQNGNLVDSFKAAGSLQLGSQYPAGVYFVKVKTAAGEETLKLIKMK